MNYIDITKEDVANGTGIRVTLWCAGCRMQCAGCHNPESHNFNAGEKFTNQTMDEICDALKPDYINGLTLSGGHPLDPRNIDTVIDIVRKVKLNFPNKTIWLYTGYTLCSEHFTTTYHGGSSSAKLHNKLNEALTLCDVVVDGCYQEDLRDITLKFRGSSNQRIIDVKETIKGGIISVIREDDLCNNKL